MMLAIIGGVIAGQLTAVLIGPWLVRRAKR